MFWDAAVDPNVIGAEARPCDSSDVDAVDLKALKWPVTILVAKDRQDVLIESPQGSVRLTVLEGDMLAGPVTMRYILQPSQIVERTAALRRWDALVRTGRWPDRMNCPSPRSDRWPLIIATLDAIAQKCSLRETATVLFGEEMTEREWHHTSDHLKLRTRRLVAQARRLADGAYLTLLK